MKKIYHLAKCTTCQRIIGKLNPAPDVEMQEIKTQPITEEQLEEMKNLAGSYEALFSRNAIKYRSQGLNQMNLNEEEYRKYILREYTFLKRPVVIVNDKIFIGNSSKSVEAAGKAIHEASLK